MTTGKKTFRSILASGCFLLLSFTAAATQTADSANGTLVNPKDPAQNRLFWMSTGRTMPDGRFSLSNFEIFLMQIGYAPTDYLHLNFSYLLPVWGFDSDHGYWSVGGKFQLLSPRGYFQGFSIGSDAGFFSKIFEINKKNNDPDIVTFTASVSAGGKDITIHASAIQILTNWNDSKGDIPTFLQLGSSLLMAEKGDIGTKIIIETFFARSYDGIYLHTILPGIRFFGKNIAGEIAIPCSKSLFGRTTDYLRIWHIPYFSTSIFF